MHRTFIVPRIRLVLFTIGSASFLTAFHPDKLSLEKAFTRINNEVKQNSRAYQTLADASERIGHRLTGSPNGSRAEAGSLDERLSGMDVKIDGDLATVWTPYSFYYNGQQSHCGANAFTLVRAGGAWKIQNIIDTRRKCQ